MIKYFCCWLLLISVFWVALPAEASVCRNYQGREICIVDIKRSAKNYWEYRVILSVDRVKQPLEVYNCRDRTTVKKDGTVLAFGQNNLGEIVCSFFDRK
ncbi:hypothetical protein [Tychonema sp. LEGE 07203]|uniref:hypothetical protein n=1 Tax=Tychonema sp. LEGE 07203 TaxID=1828671 RepID=UPI00187EDB74|nr:hypothetical protein [Tychonema sp. LEGE 07203]MBE9093353.1 hypothetical protein [Tychonema sp. LEGE 07203]